MDQKHLQKTNDNLDEQNLYKLTNRISKRQKQLAKEEPKKKLKETINK